MIYRYSVCVCDFYEICCNTWNTRNLGVQGPNIFVQKVIMSPQKCALIPQNISFNHIHVTFSLSKIIKAFLPKMSQVAYMRFCWPNSPRCQDQGVNFDLKPNIKSDNSSENFKDFNIIYKMQFLAQLWSDALGVTAVVVYPYNPYNPIPSHIQQSVQCCVATSILDGIIFFQLNVS